MSKILLTNGAYKQTLAIARSLGAAGYEVGIVSHHALSVSFFSKYCRHRHIIQSSNPQIYVDNLISLLKTHAYDVVLPVGYPVTGWLAEQADVIRAFAKLPLAPLSTFKIFENKHATHDLAQKLHIPVPKTFAPKTIEQAEDCLTQVSFPIVFKKIKEGENRICYAQNAVDFFQYFNEFQSSDFIIQEYINGRGAGYFALYDKGVLKQDFMHLRLREYPVEGGASCFAESIDNQQLREYGERILTAAHWHGVAMVEFKFDAQGQPRLLEVNPKFWGSYDLCVAAGADFAVPYIQQTLGLPSQPPASRTIGMQAHYKTGLRFSWLMNGDLLHGLAQKNSRQVWSDFFQKNTYSNLSWRDPLASLFLIFSGLATVIRTLVRK
jgi:predicted ATP-grasp superfamily ATP-dependent carboligase